MAIQSRSIADQAVKAYKLSDGVRKHGYMYERFNEVNPIITRVASTINALPTAAAGQVCTMLTPGGNVMEYYQSTAQTLQPIANSSGKGLVLDGDQVDNETAEYVPGGNVSNGGMSRVVGTAPDFGMRVTLEITDASGSDQLIIGWRKQEAYQVPVSFLNGGDGLYTDFAGIGFCAAKADPNPVGVTTDIGNAGTAIAAAISFTWADTKIHQLECRVIGRKPYWFINGVALGGTVRKDATGTAITAQTTKPPASYTFTNGLTLIPFIFVRQDADLTDAVYLREIEIGDLDDMGIDPSKR